MRLTSEAMPLDCRAWHRHPYLRFIGLPVAVVNTLTISKTCPLTAGQLIFISHGPVHSWSLSQDAAVSWLAFRFVKSARNALDLATTCHFFFGPATPSAFLVPSGDRPELRRDFEALVSELDSSDPLRFEVGQGFAPTLADSMSTNLHADRPNEHGRKRRGEARCASFGGS